MEISKQQIEKWQSEQPLLKNIMNLETVMWINPHLQAANTFDTLPLNKQDMENAEQLWHRFAPFFKIAFPETAATNGVIESPLTKIDQMKQALETHIAGDLYLKCDNALPIAGSIKARGGFYEVLYYAEQLAKDAGLIEETEDYAQFASNRFKDYFNNYTIGVGSTGNLGLSIGIMSAKLGFHVDVYMSADAKQWKKDLLRAKGATVHEFEGDFGEAIYAGREKTKENPKGYFVDDEDSKLLYLGYSTAAIRLEKQLKDQNIKVDAEHPLFVYSPCGVGGSPGGVSFGLKQIFGDDVHCFFVEPTKSPAVLVGLLTGEMDKVCVQDFGLSNQTEADGLAVGRPSSFATGMSDKLISGEYTIEDDHLYKLLALLQDTEGIRVEPSATAGLIGPGKILQSEYMKQFKEINQKNITHIAWSTGGDLVPDQEMQGFYEKGKDLLK